MLSFSTTGKQEASRFGLGKLYITTSKYQLISDFARPIDEHNERVPLYNLGNYRVSRQFQNPCCLCASENPSSVVESAIYVATAGPYRGFWVAACAQDSCGYFGKYFAPTRIGCDTSDAYAIHGSGA